MRLHAQNQIWLAKGVFQGGSATGLKDLKAALIRLRVCSTYPFRSMVLQPVPLHPNSAATRVLINPGLITVRRVRRD